MVSQSGVGSRSLAQQSSRLTDAPVTPFFLVFGRLNTLLAYCFTANVNQVPKRKLLNSLSTMAADTCVKLTGQVAQAHLAALTLRLLQAANSKKSRPTQLSRSKPEQGVGLPQLA